MDYFPAFLDLRDRPCLLVGGGDIALRKARLLSSAGARLTIVAPEVNAELEKLARSQAFRLVKRPFLADDVVGNWLVVSATGDPQTQRDVFLAANRVGIFCNGVDDKSNSSYITPAIVDRSPVVVAISSGGSAPVLARKLRGQIELLLPTGISRLSTIAREWRSRVNRKISEPRGRRRFWEAVFDGPAASRAIAGDTAAATAIMADLLETHGIETHGSERPGEAWLVGAGPGDPGLLTIRALQVMQMADVIVHDRLVSPKVLALARRDANLVSVGKSPGCTANSQEETNALLLSLVAAGKRVCRLKGGDPFIFGRGGEEAEALAAAGFSYQVVPGITAAAGCAAYAGIPLTHRDLSQSVAFVTAHGKGSVDKLDWPSLARDRQTIAFYMAVSRFADLKNKLIENGRSKSTPVAIIENGTTDQQRVIRGSLGQLTMLARAHRVSAPAMLIVGEVAQLGSEAQTRGPEVALKYAEHYTHNTDAISKQGQ